MACTGIGPYTWYLYNENWVLVDCVDNNSTSYSFSGITGTGVYNVVVVHAGVSGTTQFTITGNETCCWDAKLYQPCNESCSDSCQLTVNQNTGAIDVFFKKINDVLGFNSTININSRSFDVSVLYSSEDNKGPNVYFQSLLRSYECCQIDPGTEISFTSPCINEPVYKVLQFCNNCDADLYISGYTLSNICSSCPDGYILESDGVTCSQYLTTSATTFDSSYTAYTGNKFGKYNAYGTDFYYQNLTGNLPYQLTGNSVSTYDNTSNIITPDINVSTGPLWYNMGNFTDGRLNNTGIWATLGAPTPNPPINEWIGFTYCLILPNTSNYSIGFASDNESKFYIDGSLFFTSELLNLGSDHEFDRWRVFETHLTSGKHIIEILGKNDGWIASMGFEVYNAGISILSGMTTPSQLSAVTVFSTANLRSDVVGHVTHLFTLGEYSGHTCPDGYSFDVCSSGSPVCTSIIHIPLSSNTSCDQCTSQCLDNWDIRFLSYTGNCVSRELIEFSPYNSRMEFNNNCDDVSLPYSECKCFYVAIGYRGNNINDHYTNLNLVLSNNQYSGFDYLKYQLHGRSTINYPTTGPVNNILDGIDSAISKLSTILGSPITSNLGGIDGDCPIKPSCDCLEITTGNNTNDNNGYPISIAGVPFYQFRKEYSIYNKCYIEFDFTYLSASTIYSGLTIDYSNFNGVLGKDETATLGLSYISNSKQDVIGSVIYEATGDDPFLCSNSTIYCPGVLIFDFVSKPVSLIFNPTPYNFGIVGNGCCVTSTFTLQNIGGQAINIANLTLTNPSFKIIDPPIPLTTQKTLGINGSMSIKISFCPSGCTDGTKQTTDLIITTVEYGNILASSLTGGFDLSGTCVTPTISASTDSFVFIKRVDEQLTSGLTICNRTSTTKTIDISNCIQVTSGNTTQTAIPLNYGFEIINVTQETLQDTITYPRSIYISGNTCTDLTVRYDILQPNKTFCSIFLHDNCNNVTEIPFTGYSLPNPIVITSTSYTNPTCFGNSNGSVTISFSGGALPYSYSFSGNGLYQFGTTVNNTISFHNLSASTTGIDYIFNLSGDPCNGTSVVPDLSPFITSSSPEVILSSPVIVTLIEPTYLEITSTNYTGQTCVNLASASITITGGTTPYIFTWSNGISQTGNTTPYTSIISELNSGTYGVSVIDFNGCQKYTNVDIPDLLPITTTIDTTTVSCYSGFDGRAMILVFDAVDPVNYSWSGFTYDGYNVFPDHIDSYTATTSNSLTAGTYVVSYIDGNGCSGYTMFDIIQPDILGFYATSSNVTCSYLTNGSVFFDVISGGTYPYMCYLSGNTVIYSSTTQNITGVASGNYNAYVVDNNNCLTSYQPITITKPDPFNITYDYTATTCYNSSDGQILLSVTGGVPPYSYNWIPSIGSGNYVTGLSHGYYGVNIFDSNGCSIYTGITLPFNSSYCGDLIVLDYDGSEILPIDGVYNISMPYTCLSSFSEKMISLCQNSPCRFNIVSYSGISTSIDNFYLGSSIDNLSISSSGCSTMSLIFNPISAQTYNKIFNITTEYCSYYFSLNGTGVNSIISVDTLDIDFGDVCFGSNNTTYLTVTNLTPDDRPIQIQTVPTEFTSINTFILLGNSTATIPYTFTPSYSLTNPIIWERSFTGTTKITNCPTLEVQLAGTGHGGNVMVSNLDFGCVNKNCYLDQTSTIYNNHCMPVSISAVTIPSYYSPELTVLDFVPTTINPGDISTFTVRYSAITSLSTYFQINTDYILSSSVISGITACMVDTLGNVNPISPIITVPGTSMSTTVEVINTTISDLFVSAHVTNSSGLTPTNITVSPVIVSLPPPILPITGTTNSFTLTFYDLNPVNETYYLNLTDNCGNHISLPFHVMSSSIGYTNEIIINPSCYGLDNGSISIIPTGGTSPHTVVWSNGITGNSISNLISSTYDATIFDLFGNSDSFTFDLIQPNELSVFDSVPFNGYVNILVYGNNTGYINLNVTGGTSPYIYFWSGNTYQGLSYTNNQQNISGLTAGDYLVAVTDINGCQVYDLITLSQPDPLSIIITNCTPPVPPSASCTLTGGTANIIVSGGQGPYDIIVCPTVPQNPLFDIGGPYYGLTTCQTLPSCSGLTSGITCVTQMCYCCDESLAPCSDPSCPITMCNVIINNLPPGNYPPGSFGVTDANSGSTTYIVPTFVPDPSTLGFILTQSQTSCGGQSNGSITAQIVLTMNQLGQYGMGIPPYTYFINGSQYGSETTATTITFTGLTSNNYSIGVQDSDLNFVSQLIFVNQGSLSASISTTPEEFQNGNGSIIINNIYGGIAPYSASINSTPQVVVTDGYIFNNLSAGAYLIEIVDSLGCHYSIKPVISRVIPQEAGSKTSNTKTSISNPTIYEKRLGGFKLNRK